MDPATQLTPPYVAHVHIPEKPSQHFHPENVATKCGHQLHASAPPHTPNCPACILASAKTKLEAAQDRLLTHGGLQCSLHLRDSDWKRAYLSYDIATQQMEKARKKDQLRWEREQAWDEAHLKVDLARIDEGCDLSPSSSCPICVPAAAPRKAFSQMAREDVTWWDWPGTLASEEPQTPPRPRRSPHRRKDLSKGKASPCMRQVIREHRAALVSIDSEQKAIESRYKTEAAVRRKHQLGEETQFDAHFWDSPISGVITRQNHRQLKDYQRSQERRARGNTPRPRPPRSSLSFCESIGEFEADESLRHTEELQRLERKGRKIGAEVGYLYFIGAIDGLEVWKEDYLRSNHNLIWRERYQRGSIEAACFPPADSFTMVEALPAEDRMDIDEEL